MNNNTRPEDLGSMGESFFNTLCKDIGFVANSSKNDDKGGWDFEVEYRRTKEINYSNQSYPVYRVQVKTTSRIKNETKLTYSNLLKLIQYNGASFIVLIKYSISINPDTAFIFHIDENFANSVLMEIRKKEIKLKTFALNKNEKIIKFSLENEIKPLNGVGLKIAFDKLVGSEHLKYVENKLKYLSKFEKEGQIKAFDWTIKSEADIMAMVNCFLGYKERFNIDVDEYIAPYGIKDKIPTSTFKDHNTTIDLLHDELPQTNIYLKSSQYGKQYEFIGTTFTIPQQLSDLVPMRARTKCKLFDIIYDHKDKTISLHTGNIFEEDIKVTYKELYNFFCFLNDSINGMETYINTDFHSEN